MNDSKPHKPPTDTVVTDKVRPVSGKNQGDSQASEMTDVAEVTNETETPSEKSHLTQKVSDLEAQLAQAQDSLLRSQADYQNLQRRTQDEKSKWLKLAAHELVSDLIQPLDHLSMAAQQLKDPGLSMTITQFWQTLKEHGLQELEPVGEQFDVNRMDAVDRQGEGETVLSVVKRGYILNGEVIQHAKVVVGDAKNSKK